MVKTALSNSYYEKFADGKVVCIDDEIPFEIPNGWEWCRVREISQSYIGLTYSPSEVSSDGVIVLRSSNIQNGKISLNDIVRVKSSISEKLWVEENDIIICARNGSKKLVGKSAIVEEISEPMTFGAFMTICKTVLYRYVHIFLQSDLFFSQLRNVSGTTTINQLTQNNFNGFLIPIPPKREQERISNKLSDISPLVDKYGDLQCKLDSLNTRINELLKKSILQEAIQGKLVPQAPNDEPASVLLQHIKEEKQRLVKEGRLKKKDIVDSIIYKGDDNKYYEQIGRDTIDISNEILFDLPCSWQWVRFGQIVRMSIGKTPARGEVSYWSKATIPWVSISDMTNSEHINKTKEKISVVASSVMGEISPVGSLLMSFKLTVGRTSILNIDAYHNEAIISIYPFIDDKYALRDYLFYTLPFLSNMGDSKDAIKGKTLNSKSLKSLLIPLPPLREQRYIINRLEELYAHL
jgi:hypothetical protein